VMIPDRMDWRDHKNQNYLSMNRNQYSPNKCESSWAMAGASALSDRINIQNGNKF